MACVFGAAQIATARLCAGSVPPITSVPAVLSLYNDRVPCALFRLSSLSRLLPLLRHLLLQVRQWDRNVNVNVVNHKQHLAHDTRSSRMYGTRSVAI